VRSHVADCAEHESECDDWEEVVAEGGRGRTGPYGTACHLYLQPSGQPSAQPHGGNQHAHPVVKIPRYAADLRPW